MDSYEKKYKETLSRAKAYHKHLLDESYNDYYVEEGVEIPLNK